MLKIDYNSRIVTIGGTSIRNIRSLPSPTLLTIFGNCNYIPPNLVINNFTAIKVNNDSRYEYNYDVSTNSGKLYIYKGNEDLKYIFLLLESPSRSEMNYHFSPNMAANGMTGCRIDKYLENVLNSVMKSFNPIGNEIFNVRIVNSVRNQTDLYSVFQSSASSTSLKKVIWYELFKNQGEEINLKNEINFYNPVIIINATTKILINKKVGTIQNIVSSTIDKIKHGSSVLCPIEYRTNHPSTWESTNCNSPFKRNALGYYEW